MSSIRASINGSRGRVSSDFQLQKAEHEIREEEAEEREENKKDAERLMELKARAMALANPQLDFYLTSQKAARQGVSIPETYVLKNSGVVYGNYATQAMPAYVPSRAFDEDAGKYGGMPTDKC
jgi:hypothetical protein